MVEPQLFRKIICGECCTQSDEVLLWDFLTMLCSFKSKDKACCMSGPTLSSYSSCSTVLAPIGKSSKIKGGAIAGIVIGVVALIVALFALWKWKCVKPKEEEPVIDPNAPLSNNSVASSDDGKQPTGNDILPDKNPQPLLPPPISRADEENMIKIPPPVPLDSPPPLPKPHVPSQ